MIGITTPHDVFLRQWRLALAVRPPAEAADIYFLYVCLSALSAKSDGSSWGPPAVVQTKLFRHMEHYVVPINATKRNGCTNTQQRLFCQVRRHGCRGCTTRTCGFASFNCMQQYIAVSPQYPKVSRCIPIHLTAVCHTEFPIYPADFTPYSTI